MLTLGIEYESSHLHQTIVGRSILFYSITFHNNYFIPLFKLPNIAQAFFILLASLSQ